MSFAKWRSRLPAAIGSWFARELAQNALALVEGGRVALTSVEDLKIVGRVSEPRNGSSHEVLVEWASGTGPLALRPLCSCANSGICEHIVAVLETVRSRQESSNPVSVEPIDLSWLPVSQSAQRVLRARCVWVVFSASDAQALTASLVLDSPRLRGVSRDAQAIIARMGATPADDWDEIDRELLRDEFVQEAFAAGRIAPKALARAMFALVRHPRVRFDDDPLARRHPSELDEFALDLRGLRLRAKRYGNSFGPLLEALDGTQIDPKRGFSP